jgi:hypothetical protein
MRLPWGRSKGKQKLSLEDEVEGELLAIKLDENLEREEYGDLHFNRSPQYIRLQARTAVLLHRSSKRLEFLTLILAILTGALIGLTFDLLAFHP